MTARPDFNAIARSISPLQLGTALEAEKVGTNWRCPLPEHHKNADRKPSFSIFREGGRTMAKCHACGLNGSPVTVASVVWNCDELEASQRLVEAVGLSVPSYAANPAMPEVETYGYVDEHGNLLFEVVRYDPKSFRQRKPDGRGDWLWKLDQVRRVPYRLPAVIEAVALKKTIHIVEGEKDVHAIEEAGGVATCNPGGAGKWREEYSNYLRDADVVVVADRDEPGRRHASAVASSLRGNAASVSVVEGLVGNDAADHLGAGHTLNDFVPIQQQQQHRSRETSDSRRTHAQVLLELAECLDCWHSPDQTSHATLTIEGHREHHPIRSRMLQRWLVREFYEQEGKPPHTDALYGSLRVLEAKAQFDGAEHPVFVRVGEHAGSVYLDLGRPSWEAVRVTEDGWGVETSPPVRFIRAPGMAELPFPEAGGSIEELKRFVNVGTEEDFRLLVGWLVAGLRPRGPYPIEILGGEQGSAKSTTQRVQRAMIDPNIAPLRSPPRNERDLVIAAKNGWLLAFDNVAVVGDWLSDAMCRLSTGGGFSTRQLYTDSDEMLFDGQRPLLLNGIGDIATRDDLRDRALIISLPPIRDDQRRSEARFWAEFREAKPRLLGALLDGVSAALRRVETIQFDRLPRMADFARWVTAAEPALDWPNGAFLAAYDDNRASAVELSLEFNPVACSMRDLVEKGPWEGTASELLAALDKQVAENERGSGRRWPSSPRSMSNALDRAAATLRGLGVDVERHRESNRRVIRIRKT